MEIKMFAIGIGAAIPGVRMGANLASGGYIMLRDTPNAKPYVLGIATGRELGGKSGTLVFSWINTEWMNVDVTKHPWLCSKMSLIGKEAVVDLKGTMFLSGKIDVSLKIIDQNHEVEFSMSKINVKSRGTQLATISIAGIINDMMGKTNHGGDLCGLPN